MEILKQLNDKKIIVGLIALQLIVTLPFINSFPIDLDEPFSIFYAQQDLNEFIPFLNKGNNPPLHFILLHFWIKLFGISPLAVRSLSLVISLLIIPVLYSFSKQIVKTPLAILTVGFFIFSSFNHYHSLEARVYVIMVLLILLIFKTIHQFLFQNKKVIIKLAIFHALLMYSHYLGGIVIAIEILLLIIFYNYLSTKKLIQYFISGLLAILLFVPGLILFIERFKHFSSQGTWVEKPHITELYGNIIRFFNGTISFFVLAGLVLLIVIFNLKNIKSLRYKSEQLFVLLCFVLPYLLFFILSFLLQPIFIDRYLLFTTPFLFLSLAIIIEWFTTNKNINYSFLLVMPMVLSLNYIPKTDREADKMASYILNKNKTPHDIVICPPFYNLTFLYHYDQNLFKSYKILNSEWDWIQNTKSIQSVYNYDEINVKFPNLFFVDAKSNFLFPENNILIHLKQDYQLIDQKEFKGEYIIYQFKQK